jgi:hypothetical protein
VELKLIQQPPSQAVYQRILRPFPTVAIIGANSKSYANFFVEVTLLKKNAFDDSTEHQIQHTTWFKGSNVGTL